MDEAPCTGTGTADEGGDYQKYEQAAEPAVDLRSDRAPTDSTTYIAVTTNSARERVTVWASPASRRETDLVRFANRALGGEPVGEEDVASD